MPLVDLETIRIPEMIEHLALAGEDMIAIWDASENKTRKTPLSQIRSYIGDPSGGTFTPVQTGGSILYIVPASADGGDEINVTGTAGMNPSKLIRDGYPLNPGVEYEALSSGGVKLIGSLLIEGQRYEIEYSELAVGSPPTPTSGGGFILGNVIINTNINISISDMNKVHQIRGGSNALTVTLPNVEDCPDNSFLIIEALISNTKQHLITTTASQYIYRKNESTDQGMYMAKGDVLWFYRKADGWYVINEKGNFDNLTMPHAAYKVGFNQILCNGQELSRTLYAKTWRDVQTLGGSLVSDAIWNTASAVTTNGQTVERPYRGLFSTGDGSTTFRVPDLMNVALRGLLSDSGTDPERVSNVPGGFQKNQLGEYTDISGQTEGAVNTPDTYDAGAFRFRTKTRNAGKETRMDNVGMLWVLNY